MLANVLQQPSRCCALRVRHYALLVRWGVYLERHPLIEPYATLALPSIAVFADRCMAEFIKLQIGYFKPSTRFAEAACRIVFIIKCGTYVELAVGSKCQRGVARTAVVHFAEHHAVGE